VRVAYADPPYPGQSKRLYGDHPDYAGEVDHAELIARLMDEFPDGWALSTSAAALQYVLSLCPPPEMSRKDVGRRLDGTGVRVLIWRKLHTPWRPVGIQYVWEPVLLYKGRRAKDGWITDHFTSDTRVSNGMPGAKPYAFCAWIFDCFGLSRDDELVDLFPGSGAVTRAWEAWRAQPTLMEGTC
jgi:hypothetical protein